MARKVGGHHLADMADAKREDQPVQRDAAAFLDRGEEVRGRPLAPAVAVAKLRQCGSITPFQREDVGGFADLQDRVGKEHLHLFRAQPLDVERATADEVLELLHRLRGADEPAGAAAHGIAGFADRLGPAVGAAVREGIGFGPLRPLRQVHVRDLRDHVAGAVDLHPVADANVLAAADRVAAGVAAGDVVLVVQRRVRYHDAADRDRVQPRHRRQRPGAAHLDVDRLKPRPGELRGELVRDRPSRRRRPEPEPRLQRKVVDLVDHPVDVIAERRALFLDRRVILRQFRQRLAAPGKRVGDETKLSQPRDRARLRRGERRRHLAPAIGEEAQRPRRGHARIELAQRPGGGVARVGEGLFPRRRLPFVQRLEIGAGHVDLATHLQHLGRTVKLLRNVGDGAGVRRHVLARLAVAAGRGLPQPPALVAQRKGQTVDLRFSGEGQRRAGGNPEEAAHPRVEIGHVLAGEGVFERQHPHRVADLGEGFRGGRAHLLRRAAGFGEVGEPRLDRQKPRLQRVIVRIGDFGRIGAVIGAVGRGHLRREAQPFARRRGAVQRLDGRCPRIPRFRHAKTSAPDLPRSDRGGGRGGPVRGRVRPAECAGQAPMAMRRSISAGLGSRST